MSEVLALKYRPTTFDEVVGQDHIINQLKASIENGTLGHALLFCGTRGTGKTTTARILARELNKYEPQLYDKWEMRKHLVLTEVDAASNTGVDNVREIIDDVRYARAGDRVIVLDEAHMLSKSAFNALLKTLEEPPPHVTFILSTTEPHRLPATVKSRCQVYEFHDVDINVLTDYYTKVMEAEGKDIDVSAAALKAEGSVRDGLSILQKALSGEQEEDTSKQYFELVGAIYKGDITGALATVAEIRKVEEARVIVQSLEKWFYWCSLEAFGMRTPIREYFEGDTDFSFDLSHLQKLFQTCLDIERNFTATPNGKIVLEMGILRLCL